jgi:surface polysaccharide O-acyltransferase-like enzyme
MVISMVIFVQNIYAYFFTMETRSSSPDRTPKKGSRNLIYWGIFMGSITLVCGRYLEMQKIQFRWELFLRVAGVHIFSTAFDLVGSHLYLQTIHPRRGSQRPTAIIVFWVPAHVTAQWIRCMAQRLRDNSEFK